jgi:putative endonuclease
VVPAFTSRYGVDKLVWFEAHEAAEAAIHREKQIKEWRRNCKISLIERDNPHWVDRYASRPEPVRGPRINSARTRGPGR